MSLFVDTSVWSLALRRDMPGQEREVRELIRAIEAGETLLTTNTVEHAPLKLWNDRS